MTTYKSSPYNILIPVTERNEFLLYNTMTSGIDVLDRKEGVFMAEILSLRSFNKDSFTDCSLNDYFFDYLLEREYVLESEKKHGTYI